MKINAGVFAAVLTVCASAALAGPQEELQSLLQDVQRQMAGVQTMRADFVQTKNLRLLDREVELRGRVALEKPGSFAWRTETPIRHTMIFKKDTVLQWDEETGKVQRLSARDMPVLKMVSGQMRDWFYGNYDKVLRHYTAELVPASPLTVRFSPRETAPAASFIQAVQIRFSPAKDAIEKMVIEEKSGDRTAVDFSSVVLNEPLPPDTWTAHG